MATARQRVAQPVVAGVLALVLIGLVWARLQPTPPRNPQARQAPAGQAPAGPLPLVTGQAPAGQALTPEPGGQEPAGQAASRSAVTMVMPGRDPFRLPEALVAQLAAAAVVPEPEPAPAPVIPMPSLTVHGIFWGTTPPRAIVNSQILTEGDTIEGVQVVSIDAEGVTVEFQGARSVLQTPQSGESRLDQAAITAGTTR